MDADIAKKTWELENEVETIPASDEIFRYDALQQQQIQVKSENFNTFEIN